ncbi:hypothetical protein FN846DRAFT_903832 [Sphaerosporella brunnea]|uniref:Uncharacterized protein n=1 Tax=Sphaerosporella brunnea TaxID=1250544 RepID=A0A5J5F5Z0_9PEZI|nr:hypothetical protein FN846DRAFT_903832 [Sphaerosporella brunnea]
MEVNSHGSVEVQAVFLHAEGMNAKEIDGEQEAVLEGFDSERLAEADAEAESQQIAELVFPDEVENEGEVKEDDEAEEDDDAEEDDKGEEDDEAQENDGDQEAIHKSLQTYINTFHVHNGADSDS